MSGRPLQLSSATATLDDLIHVLPRAAWKAQRRALAPADGSRWMVRTVLDHVSTDRPALELHADDLLHVDSILGPTYQKDGGSKQGTYNWKDTGRQEPFLSAEEERTFLLLDYDGGFSYAHSQPFTLRYKVRGKARKHTPDILAIPRRRGLRPVLIDVTAPATDETPARRDGYAAAEQLAVWLGWRYLVIKGHEPQAFEVIDSLMGASRRPWDPGGHEAIFLQALSNGPQTFGELAESVDGPGVARGVLRGMLWRRQLQVDLNLPLTDHSVVSLAEPAGDSVRSKRRRRRAAGATA